MESVLRLLRSGVGPRSAAGRSGVGLWEGEVGLGGPESTWRRAGGMSEGVGSGLPVCVSSGVRVRVRVRGMYP